MRSDLRVSIDCARGRVIRLDQGAPAITEAHRLYGLAVMPQDIAAGAETWIQLFKTGAFYDWRYGDFSITSDDLRAMVENFETREPAVPGDYDHSFQMGEGSLSAGWTKAVELRADDSEMWGLVVLTERAAGAVSAGEYRFISPEFSLNHMNERGEAIGPCLLAWGLTNRPFLEGMAEVSLAASRDGRVLVCQSAAANGNHPKEGNEMDLDKLRKALGLADDATEAVILAAITERTALALNAPGPDAVILTKSEVEDLRAKAQSGEQASEALRLSTRDQALDAAVREGKLAPVALDAFKAMWDADPDSTRKALDALPVVEQFKREASGETADAPGSDDPEASIGQRIETRAQALMVATPTLSLAAAYEQADAELRPRAGKAA